MSERGCRSVGIDLGTTFSALAYIDAQGQPHIVQDSSGQAVTPSVVFFDEDEVIVGDIALQQARLRADRVVQFVKTHMGDEWRFEVDGQIHTPESVSAIVLAHLVREAEPQIGEIDSAVITVPAYFTEKRRRATQQAGEIAGLNVIGTLNEPMAAALAHGLYDSKDEQVAVVYDLGGGTFDVTVVRITPNEMEELATLGNRKLGGKDWDQCLVEHVVARFQAEHQADPRGDLQGMQDLLIACEQTKRRLGKMKKASIRFNALGKQSVVEVTREEFEAMTAHLVQTTRLTTQMALEDAGLEWKDVHRVVLVGGSTHMPMIQRMLEDTSGLPLDTSVNPVLAVALGAARYAQLLERGEAPDSVACGDESDGEPGGQDPTPSDGLPRVRFVTAHGVGIRAMLRGQESNIVLIHKNSGVPCSVSRQFRTHVKGGNRQKLSIVVTQGDTTNIQLAEVLGKGTIEGLPDDVSGGEPVQVTMAFDDQGRLAVHALYVKTGQDLRFELKIPGGLAEEEVAKYRGMLEHAGLIDSVAGSEEIEKQPLPELGFGDIEFDDIEISDEAPADQAAVAFNDPVGTGTPSAVEKSSADENPEKVLGIEDLEILDDDEDDDLFDF